MAAAFFLFVSAILLLSGITRPTESVDTTAIQYWQERLPLTPLPNTLRDLLPKDSKGGSFITANSTGFSLDCSLKYDYAATIEEVKKDPELKFVFLKKDLRPQTRTHELDFVRENMFAPNLLPRKISQTIPFDSKTMRQIILGHPGESLHAASPIFEKTIELCGRNNLRKLESKGEIASCAASMEDMIDFAVDQLKTNRLGVLTYSYLNKKETDAKSNQVFRMMNGIVELPSTDAVACHLQAYPYAVFYCHKTSNTKSYVVPLVAEEDGTRVDAGTVCHIDTSKWSPKQATMLVLNVKPGAHVCHFLSRGNYIFFPKID